MKNSANLLYSFILLVGDFVALVAAFTLAYIIRVRLDTRPLIEQVSPMTYLLIFLVLLPFWLVIFALLNMYKNEVYENRFSEGARIVVGCFIGLLFLLSAEYAVNRVIFPARLVPIYGFFIGLLLVLLSRTILRAGRRHLFGKGIGIHNVLLIGNTPVTNELYRSLSYTKFTGLRIVGVVGTEKSTPVVPQSKRFASFEEALSRLKNHTIHSIVQAELFANETRNNEIVSYAAEHHIAYRFVPGNSDIFVGKVDVELLQNIPVVSVHQTALVGWGRITKRLFDIAVSGLLLLLLSPIMLLIACVAKIMDPRSTVLFKQTRLTRFNTEFKIYKFRSQYGKYDGTTPEQAFEMMGKPHLAKKYRDNGDFLKKDPRITKLGAFLRRTSLDELPQLINIFKGDISLVGPRALIAQELNNYPYKNLILSVKSGLTGLAQISGRKEIPFEERRKLDLYYVQNWSFWFDITILLKTAVQVAGRIFRGSSD
jgi:exopolysaccharide biosynthesis polyprenyl glycosylphosphotransferase